MQMARRVTTRQMSANDSDLSIDASMLFYLI